MGKAQLGASGSKSSEYSCKIGNIFNNRLMPPGSSVGKESAGNAGDPGLIPGLGRSPGEGTGYLLQYSGLENSTDCIVHGITKSRIQLSDVKFHFFSLNER